MAWRIFPLLCLFLMLWSENSYCCNLYLAPSRIPGIERGVFAGKAYSQGALVDEAYSILVSYEAIRMKQLSNYVFTSDDQVNAIALFGAGMLYNHRTPKNVLHYYHEMPPSPSQVLPKTYSQPYSTYPMLDWVAALDIAPYEELFTSYGADNWFTSRNIILSDSPKNVSYLSTYDELERYGHCITDVYVNHSTLPLAGNGLFSKRSFQKGETVTISPVLFLSKKLLSRLSDNSVIFNYCICSAVSDVCVFPIGLGAMVNHGRPNVKMEWLDWESLAEENQRREGKKEVAEDEKEMKRAQRFPEKLSWSAEALELYPAAPLDLVYLATRDISPGEEIFLSYGTEWQNQWMEYLRSLQRWNQKFNAPLVGNFMKPQFRSPIIVPENLFPEAWHRSLCIDRGGCEGGKQKNMNKRRRQIELRDIKEAKQFTEQYFRKHDEA
jgi:hypothetical protein